MAGIKNYLLTVTAAAILCSILVRVAGKKGTAPAIIRLLSGLFMTATVLSPLITLELDRFADYTGGLSQQASQIAQEGTQMARQEMETIIISQTESYIQEKASALGVTLEVQVILNNQIPDRVMLSGAISPGAKVHLTAWITNNLGIPPEAQEWI